MVVWGILVNLLLCLATCNVHLVSNAGIDRGSTIKIFEGRSHRPRTNLPQADYLRDCKCQIGTSSPRRIRPWSLCTALPTEDNDDVWAASGFPCDSSDPEDIQNEVCHHNTNVAVLCSLKARAGFQLGESLDILQHLFSSCNSSTLSLLSAKVLAVFAKSGMYAFPKQVHNKKRRQEISLRLSQLIRETAELSTTTNVDAGASADSQVESNQVDQKGTAAESSNSNATHRPAFAVFWTRHLKRHLHLQLRGGEPEVEWTTSSLTDDDHENVAPHSMEISDSLQPSHSEMTQDGEIDHVDLAGAAVFETNAIDRHRGVSDGSPKTVGIFSKMASGIKSGLLKINQSDADLPGSGGQESSSNPKGSDESSEIAWGPGRGQMESCITNEWDGIYPADSHRWKNTSYHDDIMYPSGHENEWVHANQSWKKYPPSTVATYTFLNEECGMNLSLEPAPDTWDPDLYRPTFRFRPIRQIAREMYEERALARERCGLAPASNRTRERLGRELYEICSNVSRGADYDSECGPFAVDTQAALERLRAGADPNYKGRFGVTALHLLCAADGHEGLIEELLRRGAEANVLDGFGRTPLHAAVRFRGPEQKRSLATVRLLLAHGARAHEVGGNKTCVEAAEEALYYNVVASGWGSQWADHACAVVRLLGGDESAGLDRCLRRLHRRHVRAQRDAADAAAAAAERDKAMASDRAPALWGDADPDGY